jgi:hypothetical protein
MYNDFYSQRENAAMNSPYFNAEGDGWYGADFYNAGGAPAPMQAVVPQSVPFSIQFANGSTNALTATIWDAANSIASGSSGNYQNNASLTITVVDGQYSYAQLLYYVLNNPMRIARIDIEAQSTSTNVNSAVTITEYDQFGKQGVYTKLPGLNKFQQLSNVVTVDYGFTLNAFTKVTQTIAASATVVFRFYPNAIINPSQAVTGQQPTMMFGAPKTQGVEYLSGVHQVPAYRPLQIGQ